MARGSGAFCRQAEGWASAPGLAWARVRLVVPSGGTAHGARDSSCPQEHSKQCREGGRGWVARPEASQRRWALSKTPQEAVPGTRSCCGRRKTVGCLRRCSSSGAGGGWGVRAERLQVGGQGRSGCEGAAERLVPPREGAQQSFKGCFLREEGNWGLSGASLKAVHSLGRAWQAT